MMALRYLRAALMGQRFEDQSWRKRMDTLGIEPNTSRKQRMLSERDNQLHHVPCENAIHLCHTAHEHPL